MIVDLAPGAVSASVRRVLLTAACALAVLGSPPLPASPPYPPPPGQPPAKVEGPAVEAPRVGPAPERRGMREQPSQIVDAPAGGKYVALRDVPRSTRPARGQAERSHTQGDERPSTGGSEAVPRFRKAPASPRSPEPVGAERKSAGDFVRSIQGITDSETIWSPPDMVLAVGPSHIVEAVNSGFAIYTKLGTEVEPYRTFDDFFDGNKPSPWDGFMFDPRIVFDPVRERFVMLALGKDETNLEAYLFLGFSESSDPTGDWCTRRIEVTDTSGTSAAWLDYAGLGVDSFGMYVTGNLFYFTGGKRGAALRSFNTDIFDDCTQGLTMAVFSDVKWPNGDQADSLQPAHPHTVNSDDETFFVATYPSSGDQVLLARLSGDRVFGPTLSKVAIDIPAYDEIGNSVDQPNSATDLDGGRAKVQNAVYANRRVFFTLTDDVQNDGSAAGWLTVKLDTDLETKEWHHLLWGGEGIYYFYPALTLDGTGVDNNLAVFGSWTDAETTITATTRDPSGLFKIYENQPSDSTGTFIGTPVGSGSYVRLDLNNRNRWGDYSGAAYDWTCGHAWGVVESTQAVNTWETTILGREFDDEGECPMLEVVAPAPGVVWTSGTTATISWLSDGLPATDEINIHAWTDGGVQTVVEGLSPNATSFQWNVPEVRATGALLSMGSWDGSTYNAIAWSKPFDIVDGTAPTPDPMTWNRQPGGRSTTSVEMLATTAVDGVGAQVEYAFDFTSSPTGGTGGSDSGWIAGSNYEDLGLQINQQYCYRAQARDDLDNATDLAPERCAYTLAANPAPAAFGPIARHSIVVNWLPAGNPASVQYNVQNVTAGTSSGWRTGTTWTSIGLPANTAHAFRVRARNGDGVETVVVNIGIATTLP